MQPALLCGSKILRLCGLFVVLATLVVTTAGCSGDSESSDDTETTATETTPTDTNASAASAVPPRVPGNDPSASGQEVLDALPTLTPATEDTKVPRVKGSTKGPTKDVKGSQNMTVAQFLWWSAQNANNFWSRSFAQARKGYLPSYVSIIDTNKAGRSNCVNGEVGSDDGPFYCPADYPCSLASQGAQGCGHTFLTAGWLVAVPLRQFGDFAVSMVVAHEWGHHVQNLLGILDTKATGRIKTIHTELQADCLAGVWANSVYHQGLLEAGDVQEASRLAYAIGDDLPWTHPDAHGTPTQRSQWFMYGYNTGDASKCKTF